MISLTAEKKLFDLFVKLFGMKIPSSDIIEFRLTKTKNKHNNNQQAFTK